MDSLWIIDGHSDSLLFYLENEQALIEPRKHGQWDLLRARKAGVKVQFLAAFIEANYKPSLAMLRGLELIEAAQRFEKTNNDQVFMIRSSRDLKKLAADSKMGLVLSVEGGEILGESLFMLDIIYALGVRALGLTWNQRNAIGDGAGETDTGSRLTKFGERVVARMNELGMVIDVSHLNQQGFWHVLNLSSQPVIASHSCAQSLCHHPRNLSDEQIKALAAAGGVIGVNFYPPFLHESGQAGIEDIVKHICHIVEIGGIDVVGFGSDFDGIDKTPTELHHVGDYTKLVERLSQVGFSSRDLEKICHQNFFRVLLKVVK